MLVLADTAATWLRYPFGVRLAINYAVDAAHLDVSFEITNTGEEMLPASIGTHPAFNSPLLQGLDQDAYSITFSNEEREPIRRLKDGLLKATSEPTPVQGKILPLSARLFDDDAIIIDRLASTALRYGADRGPSIEISWQGFQELGLWSKPSGAPFLCIEPWCGFASPEDFDGEFTNKPALMHLAPGKQRTMTYRIDIG